MTIDDAYQRIAQACEDTFAHFDYQRISNPNPAWCSGDRCQIYQGSVPGAEYWQLSVRYRDNFIVLEMIAAKDLPMNVCWVDIWPASMYWNEQSVEELDRIASEFQAELAAWLKGEHWIDKERS